MKLSKRIVLKNKYQEDKIYAGTDVNNHECFGEYLKIYLKIKYK